jgi:hypothetical protein
VLLSFSNYFSKVFKRFLTKVLIMIDVDWRRKMINRGTLRLYNWEVQDGDFSQKTINGWEWQLHYRRGQTEMATHVDASHVIPFHDYEKLYGVIETVADFRVVREHFNKVAHNEAEPGITTLLASLERK